MMHPGSDILVQSEKMRREELLRESARGRLIGQARRGLEAQPGQASTSWRRTWRLWAALRSAVRPAA